MKRMFFFLFLASSGVLYGDGLPELQATFPKFVSIEFGGKREGTFRHQLRLHPDLRYLVVTRTLAPEDNLTDPEFVRIECGREHRVEIGFTEIHDEEHAAILYTNSGSGEDRMEVRGDEFAVGADCNIYYSNYGDSGVTHHKIAFVNGRYEHVRQPYLLVDRTCAANGPAQLMSEPCGKGKPVATLPDKSPVRILLMDVNCESVRRNAPGDVDWYLVVTPFGLTGWVENRSGWGINESPGKPLSCIQNNTI